MWTGLLHVFAVGCRLPTGVTCSICFNDSAGYAVCWLLAHSFGAISDISHGIARCHVPEGVEEEGMAEEQKQVMAGLLHLFYLQHSCSSTQAMIELRSPNPEGSYIPLLAVDSSLIRAQTEMDRPATEVEVSQQPDDSEPERQCSNVSDLIESHLDRLRSIGNRRFEFINLMQSDWRQFAAEREEWEKGLQATIEALKRQGYQKAADDLAAGVFSKKIVSEPGNFNIIWSTGHGLEKITTVLEGREHDDLSLAPGWGSPHVPQVGFDLLSLAELVEVDFAPRDSLPLESVWQWICCSKSGFAFCLCCPCGPIAIPSLRLGDSVPTHEILPRAFCLNPLEDGNAVKHFREVHGLDRSIKELLREYGKQGVCVYV